MNNTSPLCLATRPVLEALENRQLLAASLNGKELLIVGTTGADTIGVTVSSTNVRVAINGAAPQTFATSKFSTIRVIGDKGNDTITMASNLPKTVSGVTIDAGQGNDTVSGSNKSDNITGGQGHDSLLGNGGDDTLNGNDGSDTLDGGAGDRDRVFPGTGNDNAKGGLGTFDTISYQDRTDGVTVRIDGLGASGNVANAENDTVATDFENAVGGKGNDLIIGSAGNNVVGGDLGNDTLDGGRGDDSIWGDGGSDTVTYASRTKGVLVSLDGIGNDGEPGENDDLFTMENIIGGASHDVLNGDDNANTLDGGSNGNDTINGNGGNDNIAGGNGRDSITGGNGADRIRGGNHDDVIAGNKGNDQLFGDGGNDRLDGGDNNDRLFGGTGNDSLIAGAGADQLDGGDGTDSHSSEAGDILKLVERKL